MKNKFLFILTAALMFILGASDTLRGVFSPLFVSSFGLSLSQIGLMVSASYVGNIIFLLLGGYILDKTGTKKALVSFVLLLAASEILLLFSRGFASLAVGFFLALGLSTLLNTTVNLYSGSFSENRGLMFANILFFIQGIGTTLSQLFLSKAAGSITLWSVTLIVFSTILVVIAISVTRVKDFGTKKQVKEQESSSQSGILFFPITIITLSLSLYLIAEHGVMNYLILYGENELGISTSSIGFALSLFSFGIMTGRLIFSPLIDRIGDRVFMFISLTVAFISAMLVFYAGILPMTLLLGLASSTVYPTMVAMVRKHVPSSLSSRATTIVVSIASVLDVIFNMGFGFLTDSYGYRSTMLIIAFANLIAAVLFIPMLLRKKQ
ncbi:MAG: MFS transporter [Bullifex sp.]